MPQTGPDQKLSILAVVAHPHDISSMLGTLAHHINRGDSVTAVAATGGYKLHREKLHDELGKPPEKRNKEIVLQSKESYVGEKTREMAQACALFGITDVRALPFPDTPFEPTLEVIETLTEIVYEVCPHLVLTHAPTARLRHGYASIMPDDHPLAGIAIQKAIDNAARADAETKHSPHQVAAVYYTGVDFPVKEADLFVDITDQAANRIKAEMLFTTQAHTPEWAYKRIHVDEGNYGWHAKVGYAEGWVRSWYEVGQYLTITDHDLETAKTPQQEIMARRAVSVSAED